MKRFWMALAWLMVLPLASHAETITVGGKSLAYQAPAGYVVASKSKYKEPLAFLEKALPAETITHEVYIEKTVDQAYGKSQKLDDYIVIVSNTKSDAYLVALSDFEKLKEQITKLQETQLTTSAKDHSNQRLSEITEGALKIGNVRPMGVLASSDTLIAFMAVVSQSVNLNNGQRFVFDQAFASTTLLAESKVLSINHFRTVHSEEDISRFKSDALRAVASMDFKQGAAAGVTQTRSASAPASSSSSPLSSSPDSYSYKSGGFSRVISGGIIGCLSGGVIYLFRRRKAKKAEQAQASMPPSLPGSTPFPSGEGNPVTSVRIGENLEKKDDPFKPGGDT